jgi:hypothetical protein
LESWLAGVPIKFGDKQMLPPTKVAQRTVPPKVKRLLATFAIESEKELDQQRKEAAPQIEEAWQKAFASATAGMKQRGWSDAEIEAHFKRLERRARQRQPKDFKKPTVEQVITWSRRRAPTGSPRRRRGKLLRLATIKTLAT